MRLTSKSAPVSHPTRNGIHLMCLGRLGCGKSFQVSTKVKERKYTSLITWRKMAASRRNTDTVANCYCFVIVVAMAKMVIRNPFNLPAPILRKPTILLEGKKIRRRPINSTIV